METHPLQITDEQSTLAWKVTMASLCSFALYSALELIVLIFVTFSHFRGIYFTSMFVASVGLIPYAIGFLLRYYRVARDDGAWVSLAFMTIGWYMIVTGQSVVLWSRLHLVVNDQKVLKWLLWMIIVDAVVFHLPTTVLTFGSNAVGSPHQPGFLHAYIIMEKIQMTGFCIQEFILSGFYIAETFKLLRGSLQSNTRKLAMQLLAINLIIILMDIGLVALQYANLYVFQITIKGVIYAIKLKLEYAVLSRLVSFVNGPRRSSVAFTSGNLFAAADDKEGSSTKSPRKRSFGSGATAVTASDVWNFVDRTRTTSDVANAEAHAGKDVMLAHRRYNDFDLELARLAAGKPPHLPDFDLHDQDPKG